MQEGPEFQDIVTAYLEDRDRRFGRALDAAGFAHNGPQSVELHAENGDLYCVPDGTYSREDAERLFASFGRESVDSDITLVIEDWSGDELRHVWPEDESYGPGLLSEVDPGLLPEAGIRLHLWLGLDRWVAECDVRERMDSGEDLWWMPGGGA